MAKNILFFSGSIGLGHVARDLAIARELRRLLDVRVYWLAASPADRVIAEAGEEILPQSAGLADDSTIAEAGARGHRMSIIAYAMRARRAWRRNVEIVGKLLDERRFDLLVGDETYDLALAYKKRPRWRRCPFVMIYDFIGVDALSRSPLERLATYAWNARWASGYRRPPVPGMLRLFVGEEEDVPDRPFGPLLPSRRAWARSMCRFVGYVLPFDPKEFADPKAARAALGYGGELLVICSIGGTAIGREMLDLCARAFPIARERIGGLRMVLVCGPRLDASSIDSPEGVEVRGYVPDLYRHLAACDLAIVQGGGSVTLELAALRRPFLYFPIEGHSEQEVSVAERLRRFGAGMRLRMSAETPASLAAAIAENIGKPASGAAVRTDGAREAARAIAGMLG